MKYPLDQQTFGETINNLVLNNQAQTSSLQQACSLLRDAMAEMGAEDTEWYPQAEDFFKDLHSLKMQHESRRFNEKNLRDQTGEEAIPTLIPESLAGHAGQDDGGGGEMSEEELAKMFNERPKKAPPKPKSLKTMSQREIDALPLDKLQELVDRAHEEEIEQDNSSDIYKIKARVANLARGPGMSLTPVGEILCNSFVHTLKAFYDFADKIQDRDIRRKLIELTREQEGVPGTIIGAAGAGVRKADNHGDQE